MTVRKNILLLQGPLGPFFADLARALKENDYCVHHAVFNGGDRFYSGAEIRIDFNQHHSYWPEFVGSYIKSKSIDAVVCYGDCRYYHKEAKKICDALGVEFWVLEEGYIRPSFITLECGGVNAKSPLFGDVSLVKNENTMDVYSANSLVLRHVFSRQLFFAITYYIAKWFGRKEFSGALHHRRGKVSYETFCWIRSGYRKAVNWCKNKYIDTRFIQKYSGKLFLLPLQTYNDAQVVVHSELKSVAASIECTLESFSKFAESDQALLIKHHPHDRGFTNYTQLINDLVQKYQLQGRVVYGTEYRLPEVYDHLVGCVTINSTVGLSALHHLVPTITLGRAIYDLPGLTFQGELSEFWSSRKRPELDVVMRFKANIYERSQVVGSFYCHRFSTALDVARKLIG